MYKSKLKYFDQRFLCKEKSSGHRATHHLFTLSTLCYKTNKNVLFSINICSFYKKNTYKKKIALFKRIKTQYDISFRKL